MAVEPFTLTVRKWLIPSLVFANRPDTYCTSVWYVKFPNDVCPEYVVILVTVSVGMSDD